MVAHPEGVEVHHTLDPEDQRNIWAWGAGGDRAGVATWEEGICPAAAAGAGAVGWLLLGGICVCGYGLLERVWLTVEGLAMWKVVVGGGRREDAWQE